MSKVKLLIDVISDMRSLANSLEAVADAMAGNGPADTAESTEIVVTEKKAEPKKTEPPKQKKVTLEEVRAVLAEKSQAGFTAGVREIIQKYGGSKLSEIEPEHFANILKDAEALGNGE